MIALDLDWTINIYKLKHAPHVKSKMDKFNIMQCMVNNKLSSV
jgi:hypothetical protein